MSSTSEPRFNPKISNGAVVVPPDFSVEMSDFGLIEIKEGFWINPRYIASVRPISASETRICIVGSDVVLVALPVAETVKKIAKLTMLPALLVTANTPSNE